MIQQTYVDDKIGDTYDFAGFPRGMETEAVLYCQRCKKQAATVHVTNIQQGEKVERHLCEACAFEEGVTQTKVAPFGKQLENFIVQNAGIREIANLTCPSCKLTFVEFRNSGLLGCPNDYMAFEKALVPLIERAHEGTSHHVGKIPRRRGTPRPPENDLVRLRTELTKALTQEQYEKAARLRDQIKTLEGQAS